MFEFEINAYFFHKEQRARVEIKRIRANNNRLCIDQIKAVK